jgi:hypothetical protein
LKSGVENYGKYTRGHNIIVVLNDVANEFVWDHPLSLMLFSPYIYGGLSVLEGQKKFFPVATELSNNKACSGNPSTTDR